MAVQYNLSEFNPFFSFMLAMYDPLQFPIRRQPLNDHLSRHVTEPVRRVKWFVESLSSKLCHASAIYNENAPALPCDRNYLNLINQVGTQSKTLGFPWNRACSPSFEQRSHSNMCWLKTRRSSPARQGVIAFLFWRYYTVLKRGKSIGKRGILFPSGRGGKDASDTFERL
jgi:hypothetical protein